MKWIGALVLRCLFSSVGCASAADHPTEALGGSAPAPQPAASGACETAAEGCACDEPGKTAECRVTRKAGDYVSCSIGTATCRDDRTYGPCEGAATAWDGGAE